MSWLLFTDESGHDHKQCPYEVRGGVALHTKKLWSFVKSMQRIEIEAFGCKLSSFGNEIKGSTLLDKKRFKFAQQGEIMSDKERREYATRFLEKSHCKANPTRCEFTAYGQACIVMANGIFQILYENEAVVFAAAIPRAALQPHRDGQFEEFLRKDHVFLLERYFYMLEEKEEHGLIVMDAVEKTSDSKFVRRMERYYTSTDNGRYRASKVVPSPFFVSSDMTYAIQAADVCIYAINWGYRLPSMSEPNREEISEKFNDWLRKLQYKGARDGDFRSYGIVYIPDPYTSRK